MEMDRPSFPTRERWIAETWKTKHVFKLTAMQTVTSITAEGVEWQWKSFDRAAAIARAVPELERMARFAPKESSGHMNLAVD